MIRKLFAIALLAITLTSCSEDLMDRINKDNSNPPADVVDARYIVSGAILNTGFSTISGNYAWYVSSYTEQEFGTGNNQLKNVEVRSKNETAASSTFNNEWNATYTNLRCIEDILDKTKEGGLNAGQSDLRGVALVLKALNFGILTDLHGDVPMTEALNGNTNLTPKVDKQEEIYNNLFKLLDEALECFATGESGNVGDQDILFGNGDPAKWAGLAHALKARYYLHLQHRNGNAALTSAIAEANAAIEAGFDGAQLSVFNGVTADNPWSAYHWSRYYIGASKTVADLLSERGDMRLLAYQFDGNGKQGLGEGELGEPGNKRQAEYTKVLAYPLWLENGASPINFFSKAELYFILAEAKARLGQDATADFGTAVEAAFEDLDLCCDFGGELAAAAADYIAGLGTPDLKEIMVQKYLSQIRDEQIEAYNDIRRCKANGEEFIKLTNPKNNSSAGNAWPLRLPYGESDVRSNPNIRNIFGTGNEAGAYLFTENVWWAGGSY